MANTIIVGKAIKAASFGSVQPDWFTEVDQYDVVQAQVDFVYDGENNYSNTYDGPRPGDAHPYDETLVCHKAITVGQISGKHKVTCEYVGIWRNAERSKINAQVRGLTQQEDIQSHPRFLNMAGTQDAPKNDAWTESDKSAGVFSGFPNNPSTRLIELHGVRQYLHPGVAVSGYFMTRMASDVPNLITAQGKTSANGIWAGIKLIPEELFGPSMEWSTEPVIVTTALDARKKDVIATQYRQKTWLLNSVNAESFGYRIWRINYECLLSGRRGWHDNKLNNSKYSGLHVYDRDPTGGE